LVIVVLRGTRWDEAITGDLPERLRETVHRFVTLLLVAGCWFKAVHGGRDELP